MSRAEIIATVALLVSLTSVAFSVYFNLRDRARLSTMSKFYPDHEFGDAHLTFTVVNAGRRPIVLRMWGGIGEGGEWVGTPLGKENAGLRLAEHEVFEETLNRQDLAGLTPDEEVEYVDLWVEDSLGRRHPIRDAKENIAKFWSAGKKPPRKSARRELWEEVMKPPSES